MTKQELEVWIEQYGRDIYSFCMHLTKNPSEADELYQDTWLRVMKKLPDIEPEKNIKSYCLAVAMGLWKNRKRKYAWRNRIAPQICYETKQGEEYLTDFNVSAEEELIDRQTRQTVWDAVYRLPEKLRLTVLLYYMEKLSLSQIGAVMDIPEGTVKSRLHQARKMLAEELGDLYEA